MQKLMFSYQYIQAFVFLDIAKRGAIAPLAPLHPPLVSVWLCVRERDITSTYMDVHVIHITGHLLAMYLACSCKVHLYLYGFKIAYYALEQCSRLQPIVFKINYTSYAP